MVFVMSWILYYDYDIENKRYHKIVKLNEGDVRSKQNGEFRFLEYEWFLES